MYFPRSLHLKVICNTSKSIPTFKFPAVTPETEYERSFKVSVPAKEQKVREDLEEEELPICEQINLSPDGKVLICYLYFWIVVSIFLSVRFLYLACSSPSRWEKAYSKKQL